MPAARDDLNPLISGLQDGPEDGPVAPMAMQKPPKSELSKRKRKKKRGAIINTANCKYDVVRECAESLGWDEDPDVSGESGNFNVFWTDTSVLLARVARLKNHQRINHFPSMHIICRKNHLGTTLGKMRKVVANSSAICRSAYTNPHHTTPHHTTPHHTTPHHTTPHHTTPHHTTPHHTTPHHTTPHHTTPHHTTSSGRAHPARHPSTAPPWARGAACEGQMHHCHTQCTSSISGGLAPG